MYGFLLALLAAALFGAGAPASKALLAPLDPFQLAGLLYCGAALGMAPLVARERRAGPQLRLDRANGLRLAGAVLLGGIVGPVLLLFGLRLTLAGSVSLLLNLEAAATAVLGVLLFREHLGARGWLGVAGIVVASALVTWDGGSPGLAGGLLTAGACVCWAIDNHLTALIDGITPARSTFVKGAVAGLSNLLIGAATSAWVASGAEVAAALGLGALAYGASIALYIRAAHQLGATRAQAVFASAPFVGAGLSFAFLGESLASAHLLAALLLALSIAALLASQHAHAHVHESAEHTHEHRHDDAHHTHEHAGTARSLRHSHAHSHGRLAHAHPHWPDLHHRHTHSS